MRKLRLKMLKIKKKMPFYKSNSFIRDLKKNGVTIGENVVFYKPSTTSVDLNSSNFIKIGNNVQITDGVVILGHDYAYSVVTNKYNKILRPQSETIIGDNVFIGINSIILMGTKIGNNTIIGAGSVVKGKIDSDSVYAGNPAKKICTLEEYKEKLQSKYLESARCYYRNMKNSVNENNMNIYRELWTEKRIMSEYIKKASPRGMTKSSIEKIDFERKYKNFDEFVKDTE